MQTQPSTATAAFRLPPSAFPLRSAFTLVELLVVITIIAILAALITVAASNAIWGARQTAIKMEITRLDMAMKTFKEKYGAYPPCDLRVSSKDPTNAGYNKRLRAFLSRAFPRYRHNAPTAVATKDKLMQDLENASTGGVSIGDERVFDPARALVFWLSGFSPDVTDPIAGTGARTPLFEFDKARLYLAVGGTPGQIATPGWAGTGTPGTPPANMHYVPPKGANFTPYVYFDSDCYEPPSGATPWPYMDPNGDLSSSQYKPGAAGVNAYPPDPKNETMGTAVPYVLDLNKNGTIDTGEGWASPDSIQIISAGQDGVFGATGALTIAKLFPTGTGYTAEDNDNVTNFSDKNSLEADKP